MYTKKKLTPNNCGLNISSLRNKFDSLVDQIKGNVDILVISETKLDESFPVGQFKILGFATPFRRDRNEFGGGIMVFVREDIPAKQISNQNLNIKGLFFCIYLCSAIFGRV